MVYELKWCGIYKDYNKSVACVVSQLGKSHEGSLCFLVNFLATTSYILTRTLNSQHERN